MSKCRNIFVLLVGLIFLLTIDGFSQSGKVPPFKMVQPNGKVFFAANLPIGKPIVIIYFDPGCEDCEQLTKNLVSRIDEFEEISFAMITYLPLESLNRFVTKYNLGQYSNIYIGTEGNSYFVQNYYQIGPMPFMALYNENGDLIKIINVENKLDELSTQLNYL